MSDDVEKAIVIALDSHGRFEQSWKDQAEAFIAGVKADARCWELCCDKFTRTDHVEVRFWCAKTLFELATVHWRSMPGNVQRIVQQVSWSWVGFCATADPPVPPFVANKVAQLVAFVAGYEYPARWPEFFDDLLGLAAGGPSQVLAFCRVMKALDSDIISLDIPRSQEESRRSMEFKDAMREACIGRVARAWYELLHLHHARHPDVAAAILDTVKLYVNWIDISLVANEEFAPLLLSLVRDGSSEACRVAACDVAIEILQKRMEAPAKVEIIRQLGIVPLCTTWGAFNGSLPVKATDVEMPGRVGQLLATLAGEVLEAWKRVENSVQGLMAVGLSINEEACRDAEREAAGACALLEQLMPAILQAMRVPDDDLSAPVVTFLQTYVARLKRIQGQRELTPSQVGHLRAIFEGVAVKAQVPDDLLSADDASADDTVLNDSEAGDVRRELLTLFKNAARVAWGEAVAFTGSLIQRAMQMQERATPQEVEIAVSLLYSLGEGAPEEAMKGTGPLGALAAHLMRGPVPRADDRAVTLATLECFVRYARVAQAEPDLVLSVLAFFTERGLHSTHPIVASRSTYLFMRLCKALRAALRPHLPAILAQLEGIMTDALSSPLAADGSAPSPSRPVAPTVGLPGIGGAAPGTLPSATDHRLYVFEALGYLLGQEDVPESDQLVVVTAVVDRIVGQMNECLRPATPSAADTSKLAQALQAAGYFSKGFPAGLTNSQRPAVGAQLLRQVDSALVVAQRLRRDKDIVRRAVAFVHRMVECLGPRMLPAAARLMEVLLAPGVDAVDVCEYVGLANQLVMRFRGLVEDLMVQALPLAAARVRDLLPPDFDWAGRTSTAPPSSVAGQQMSMAALSEDRREQGEVQRCFFSSLQCLAAQGLDNVLLKVGDEVRNECIKALELGATIHVDPLVRRTCLQTLGLLAQAWCRQDGTEALPGMREWAVRHVAGQCCLGSLLDRSLDVRDAGVWQLTSEAASTLKNLHCIAGDAVLAALEAVGRASEAEMPGSMAPLLEAVAKADARQVRTVLRTLMQTRRAIAGPERAGP